MKVCTGVVFLDIIWLFLTTELHQVFKNQVGHHLFIVEFTLHCLNNRLDIKV